MKRIALFVVPALIGAFAGYAAFFGPDDRELIHEALAESIVASREGKPGGVLEYLSRDLTFNDEPVQGNAEISRVISMSRPDVRVINAEPEIFGDRAQIVSPVEIKLSIPGVGVNQRLERVIITFSKEPGTRWLVLPYPKWRISGVSTGDIDVSRFEGL